MRRERAKSHLRRKTKMPRKVGSRVCSQEAVIPERKKENKTGEGKWSIGLRGGRVADSRSQGAGVLIKTRAKNGRKRRTDQNEVNYDGRKKDKKKKKKRVLIAKSEKPPRKTRQHPGNKKKAGAEGTSAAAIA